MRIWILGHQSLQWACGLSRALWVLGTGWRVGGLQNLPDSDRQTDMGHGTHGLPRCPIHDHRVTRAAHWHVFAPLASTQPRGGSMVGPVTLVWNQWRRETGAVEKGRRTSLRPELPSLCAPCGLCLVSRQPTLPGRAWGPLKPEPPRPKPGPEPGVSRPLSRMLGCVLVPCRWLFRGRVKTASGWQGADGVYSQSNNGL